MLQFDSEEPQRRPTIPVPPPRSPDLSSHHRMLVDGPPMPDLALMQPRGAAVRQAMPVVVEPRSRRRAELAAVVVGCLAFAFGVGFTVGQRQLVTPEPATVVASTVVAPPALERLVADDGVQGLPVPGSIPVGPEAPIVPNIGQLVIRSTPAGAEVVLDRVLRGTTPLSLGRLRLGQRTVQLAFGGYDMRQRVVVLTPDQPSRVIDLDLTPAGAMPPQAAGETNGATGAVQVMSTPPGARLFVNDELVGRAPLLMPGLDPGSHRVRLELEGFRSWSSPVLIEPDQRFQIDARLEPATPQP